MLSNSEKNISFEIKKRFGIITLNRPEYGNALTREMLQSLNEIIVHCQDNEKIRGILLTGNGESFTTGLDIRTIDAGDKRAIKEIENIAGSITGLLYYGKPVISAINGKAMGDGVIYALASDYRVANDRAYFQMPEIKSGIFPGTGCIVLMSRVIGIPWTKRMLMFAEKISTERALKIGLIDEIVDSKEDLMKRAADRVKFLFPKNQTVINSIKLCSNHLNDKSYMQAYELEKLGSNWYASNDKKVFLDRYRKKFM